MFGFHGKVLRVNLTDETCEELEISDDVLRKYLGGKGLEAHLMLEHIQPEVDPLEGKYWLSNLDETLLCADWFTWESTLVGRA